MTAACDVTTSVVCCVLVLPPSGARGSSGMGRGAGDFTAVKREMKDSEGHSPKPEIRRTKSEQCLFL